MSSTERFFSPRVEPWIWAYRFWARIRERAGFLANDLESDCSRSDLEQWSHDFEENPEAAADVQIAKWREKYPFFDETFDSDVNMRVE